MDSMSIRDRVNQIIEEYKDNPAQRAHELKAILKEAEKADDIHTIGIIYYYLSLCMFYQGARGSILFYAYKAVGFLETANDCQLLARSYNLLGVAYAGVENYQRAITAYNKALELIHRQKKMVSAHGRGASLLWAGAMYLFPGFGFSRNNDNRTINEIT